MSHYSFVVFIFFYFIFCFIFVVVAMLGALTCKQPTKIHFISHIVDVVLHYKRFYLKQIYFFSLHFSICHHNNDHYGIFVAVVVAGIIQVNLILFNMYIWISPYISSQFEFFVLFC